MSLTAMVEIRFEIRESWTLASYHRESLQRVEERYLQSSYIYCFLVERRLSQQMVWNSFYSNSECYSNVYTSMYAHKLSTSVTAAPSVSTTTRIGWISPRWKHESMNHRRRSGTGNYIVRETARHKMIQLSTVTVCTVHSKHKVRQWWNHQYHHQYQ